MEGRLGAEELAAAQAHLETCRTCQSLMAALAHELPEPRAAKASTPSGSVPPAELPRPEDLHRGDRVGRYVVLERAGRGASGIVLGAYDPSLDRKVAVKLLAGAEVDAASGELRLLREARAMARLAHRNVVSVYDAGTYADRVYVAMEFVEGSTLRRWLQDAPRTSAQVLSVLLDVAHGLAAAHGANIFHRDIKPDNVLVTPDGQARITDFGLASSSQPIGSLAPALSGPNPQMDVSETTLTSTGELVGTPAYMAPEQLAGESASALTDQFSFCVTAYEALYGERPFAAKSVSELIAAHQKPVPTPTRTQAPAEVLRVLKQGLQRDPAQRFPSTQALVRALEHAVGRRERLQRRAILGAASVAVLLALGLGLHAYDVRTRPCRGGPAALAGVWDAAVSARVGQAFAKTGAPFATPVLASVRKALDGYASSWQEARQEACVATQVRHEQSPQVLEGRMGCLERRLDQLHALTQVLQDADTTVVRRSVEAVESLGAPNICLTPLGLTASLESYDSPEARAQALKAREQVDEAEVLRSTGRVKPALQKLEEVQKVAERLHSRSLSAAALNATARQAMEQVDFARGLELSAKAAKDALSTSDDALGVAALVNLLSAQSKNHRFAEAHETADLAESMLMRLGRAGGVLRTQLTRFESDLALEEGHLPEALAYAEKAVSMSERELGGHSATYARTLIQLGSAQERLAKHHDAEATFRRALALDRELFGEESPASAIAMFDLSQALHNQPGHNDEVLDLLKRSLDVDIAIYGKDSAGLPIDYMNLGNALKAMGRLDEADAAYDQGASIAAHFPADTMTMGDIRLNQAILLSDRKQFAKAYQVVDAAKAAYEKSLPADDLRRRLYVPQMRADLDASAGKFAEAKPGYQTVVHHCSEGVMLDTQSCAQAEESLMRCHLALHEPADALASLGAWQKVDKSGANKSALIFLKAKALYAQGKKDQVRPLVDEATKGCKQDGDAAGELCKEIAAWSKTH